MSRFTRKTVLALAAVASLGMIALAIDDASARPGGGGGGIRGGGGGGGMHISGGGGRHISGGGGFRRIGGGFRRIDPGFGRHPHFRPHFVHRYHHHWRWRWGYRRHYWVAPVVTTAYAAAPVWNRCTCLTKEYTPEGAVVFKDLCTKEIAMNPPAVQSSAYDASQDPALQVGLQPQVQAQPALPQMAVPQVR